MASVIKNVIQVDEDQVRVQVVRESVEETLNGLLEHHGMTHHRIKLELSFRLLRR